LEELKKKNFLLRLSDLYHTEHFSFGFIGEPIGQLQSFEKSSALDKGPTTLKCGGEWGPLRILDFKLASLYFEHQV
jgi:hypothetical protein